MINSATQPELAGNTFRSIGETTGTHRLVQPWLNVLRVVWVMLLVVNLAVVIIETPLVYTQSHTLCNGIPDATCSTDLRVPLDWVNRLEGEGFSWDFYAVFETVVPATTSLVFVLVAMFICWQRSNDWMALLTSAALIAFGVGSLGNSALAIAFAYPGLQLPIRILQFMGVALMGLFVYLFPDGKFAPRWMRWVYVPVAGWYFAAYLVPGFPVTQGNILYYF